MVDRLETHEFLSRQLHSREPHFTPQPKRSLVVFSIHLLMALISCFARPVFAAPPLKVITTTGMIADVAANVGGTAVQVQSLMGEGVDPHLYKASPGDLRLLTQADLVLYNGLHLEGRLGEVLERLTKRVPTFAVTDTIPRDRLRAPSEFQGNYDPHVWFEVGLWSIVTENISALLKQQIPSAAQTIDENTRAYTAELRALEVWLRVQLAGIPPSRRLLVTAHDAFGYFGRAYGIDVMGVQGLSTDSEPSIRDLSHLVDLIVERKLPAVFIESSVPRKTVEALIDGARSRGHKVELGGELFSDAMGKAGSPEGTYLGMVRHNVSVIAAALSRPVSSSIEGTPHE